MIGVGGALGRLSLDLCSGEKGILLRLLREADLRSVAQCVALIGVGSGVYGLTIGVWNSWQLALIVALKVPFLILLVTAVNGILNGLLAQALGSGLSFVQTFQCILMSFATFSVIVASLSPVALFVAVSVPSSSSADAAYGHAIVKLFHTLLIAFAGFVANASMLELLRVAAGRHGAGMRVFFSWTLGNLFVGAQLGWVLRPFFGAPGLSVALFRSNPFEGNFYETILQSARLVF